jgi:hypothetical protein
MGYTRRHALLAAALAALLAAPLALASAKSTADPYRFVVVGPNFADGGEERLKQTLADASDKSIAFVVVTGIKDASEGCGDKLYQKRRDIIDAARRPVILSLAGSDWTGCRNSAGRSNAIERLNRLRELFYPEPESLGKNKLPLTRLSTSTRFRSYAENAHWEVGKVLYATINLPADNNHFLPAAGRNSEYEDRLVANRFWLNRLFAIARRDKIEAVVLFSEGDLKALQEPAGGLRALLTREPDGYDGFAATRRQLLAQAKKFKGKILLVDAAGLAKGAKPAIAWRENVGHVSAGAGTLDVKVTPGSETLFRLEEPKQ